jgi:hypothetical protein
MDARPERPVPEPLEAPAGPPTPPARRAADVVVGVAVLSLGAVAALWPREVLFSPAMSVDVVDRQGTPVTAVSVVRTSIVGGLDHGAARERVATDAHGHAYFPARRSTPMPTGWASTSLVGATAVGDGAGPRAWLVVALPEAGPSGIVLAPDGAAEGMASWRCVVGVGCTQVR